MFFKVFFQIYDVRCLNANDKFLPNVPQTYWSKVGFCNTYSGKVSVIIDSILSISLLYCSLRIIIVLSRSLRDSVIKVQLKI